MKKLIKWAAIGLVAVVTVVLGLVLLVLGGLYVKHRSIVGKEPALETAAEPGEYGRWVNPFIGTGGFPWMSPYNFPGADVPFGVVRLNPETVNWLTGDRAMNSSGYYYGDDRLLGFSHTRLVGTGATDGGHFLVTPAAEPIDPNVPHAERYVKFSHRNEKAFPGYYAVRLDDPGVLAEFTATARTGVHRYTFDEGVTPRIRIDVSNANGGKRSEEGFVRLMEDGQSIEGHIRTYGSFGGRYGGCKVYFAARFTAPIGEHTIWRGEELLPGAGEAEGDDLGIECTFMPAEGERDIELRLAISHVSIANARENLGIDTAGLDFDVVLGRAKSAWEDVLRRIDIEGGTDDQRTVFYTAVFRAFQMPSLFTDHNGEYMGFDKQVHMAEGFDYYTDMSLWDTFRTTHPLYTLIAPERHVDMIRSLIAMSEQGGYLPRWPSGYGYTNSMLSAPADIVISEAYLKGLRSYDIETAYAAMRKAALAPVPKEHDYSGREGVEYYLEYGYCPADKMSEAVGRTSEFAWSDFAIANLAEALGKDEDAALFREHSLFYRNLFEPQTQFFRPRNSDGTWFEPFDPTLLTYLDSEGIITDDYVEGSAWQWRWLAPYDADGMVALFESPEYFVQELNTFFEKAPETLGPWSPGPYYWQGNQPDIHAAYLFNHAGRPDLTQKWVRWILDTKFANNYVGLDGNDDGGTMSAWFVWSALGMYPVTGSTTYELGAPLFQRATIDLGRNTLTVIAENYGPDNIYVESVRLNGQPIEGHRLTHDQIAEGGELIFAMTPEP